MFDSFLFFFSLRSGSGCMSSLCLFMGLLGALLTPFLPYSVNDDRLLLIMIYMMLLIFGFGFALCGVLNYSRAALGRGFFIACLAFLYWVFLTISSFTQFNRTLDNEYCLGTKCGESHWFVPRQWNSEDFSGSSDSVGCNDQYFDDYFNLKKEPPFPDYRIQTPERILHGHSFNAGNGGRKLKKTDERMNNKNRMQLVTRKGKQDTRIQHLSTSKVRISMHRRPNAGYQNNLRKSEPDTDSLLDILNYREGTTRQPTTENMDWMKLADELLARDDRSVDEISTRQFFATNTSAIERESDELLARDERSVYEMSTRQFFANNTSAIERESDELLARDDRSVDKIDTMGQNPWEMNHHDLAITYHVYRHDERFTGLENSMIRYEKYLTIILAWLYACMFLCALVTLFLHLLKFTCPPEGRTQCIITRCNPPKYKRPRESCSASSSRDY